MFNGSAIEQSKNSQQDLHYSQTSHHKMNIVLKKKSNIGNSCNSQ